MGSFALAARAGRFKLGDRMVGVGWNTGVILSGPARGAGDWISASRNRAPRCPRMWTKPDEYSKLMPLLKVAAEGQRW